jgi:hypothetical protein
MIPFGTSFTHRDAAFAPETRAALATAPATAWAADLSIPTCFSLLWALHECFLTGCPMFESTSRLFAEVDPAARVACRGVLAAFDACKHERRRTPQPHVGFSREFLKAWAETQASGFKHTEWAGCLTADALQAMLVALDRCPAPFLHPWIYLYIPIGRTFTAQQAIFEIAGGAPLHPDEFFARISLTIQRSGELNELLRGVIKQLQTRLERVLACEVSPGEVKKLTHEPLHKVRSMNFNVFLARVHQHTEHLLTTSDEALAEQLRTAHP